MFVQTQNTPNPNSLKFVPGKKVSKIGPVEVLDLKDTNNELIRNLLSINGILSVFLYEDFLSVNKKNSIEWSEAKHIIISYINDYYSKGNDCVIQDEDSQNETENLSELEKVSRDGGDIVFQKFSEGVVTVKLKGSCSGCPSSTLTLKKGVENLLCHYIPEVKEVISI